MALFASLAGPPLSGVLAPPPHFQNAAPYKDASWYAARSQELLAQLGPAASGASMTSARFPVAEARSAREERRAEAGEEKAWRTTDATGGRGGCRGGGWGGGRGGDAWRVGPSASVAAAGPSRGGERRRGGRLVSGRRGRWLLWAYGGGRFNNRRRARPLLRVPAAAGGGYGGRCANGLLFFREPYSPGGGWRDAREPRSRGEPPIERGSLSPQRPPSSGSACSGRARAETRGWLPPPTRFEWGLPAPCAPTPGVLYSCRRGHGRRCCRRFLKRISPHLLPAETDIPPRFCLRRVPSPFRRDSHRCLHCHRCRHCRQPRCRHRCLHCGRCHHCGRCPRCCYDRRGRPHAYSAAGREHPVHLEHGV